MYVNTPMYLKHYYDKRPNYSPYLRNHVCVMYERCSCFNNNSNINIISPRQMYILIFATQGIIPFFIYFSNDN